VHILIIITIISVIGTVTVIVLVSLILLKFTLAPSVLELCCVLMGPIFSSKPSLSDNCGFVLLIEVRLQF